MKNENIFVIVNDYFENNPPPYFTFDIGEDIPIRKLKNVRKVYASYNMAEEKPIVLIDDTLFRSAKLGLLITNKFLFYRLKKDFNSWTIKRGKVPWNEIKELKIEVFGRGSVLLLNEQKIAYITTFGLKSFQRKESDILNRLFNIIIDDLPYSGTN